MFSQIPQKILSQGGIAALCNNYLHWPSLSTFIQGYKEPFSKKPTSNRGLVPEAVFLRKITRSKDPKCLRGWISSILVAGYVSLNNFMLKTSQNTNFVTFTLLPKFGKIVSLMKLCISLLTTLSQSPASL